MDRRTLIEVFVAALATATGVKWRIDPASTTTPTIQSASANLPTAHSYIWKTEITFGTTPELGEAVNLFLTDNQVSPQIKSRTVEKDDLKQCMYLGAVVVDEEGYKGPYQAMGQFVTQPGFNRIIIEAQRPAVAAVEIQNIMLTVGDGTQLSNRRMGTTYLKPH